MTGGRDCNVSFRSISDQISDHVSLALYDSEGERVIGNIYKSSEYGLEILL